MEELLKKVQERQNLDGARMVAGAVRTRFMSDPQSVLIGLNTWATHPDEFVRIASGIAFGTITVRNPDILATVLPHVEQLANDRSPVVREQGAVGALEILWLYHYDEMWLVIEDWIERRNDLVRTVVFKTMGQIVKGQKINKPSTLKQFIERGTEISDRLIQTGNPELRPVLAEAMNEFGLKAPDLIAPWVNTWANRSDLNSLSLAKAILEQPFGDFCRDIDKNLILARVAEMEEELMKRITGWLREEKGRVEYFTIIVDRLLEFTPGKQTPFHYWADPYRGCQFRCEFCATRSLAEYSGESKGELSRRVVVVANGAEVLGRELDSDAWRATPGRVVKIGMRSDPYQPAEDKFTITRELLKVFLERESPVILQTRSEMILRDLDVLEKLAERGLVNVLVSIPTPIEGIRKKVELGVDSVAKRLRTISMLSKKGVPVGLVISPIFPHLTDHPEAVEELIRRTQEAGAAFVIPEVLHLRGTAKAKARFFLETFIPDLLTRFDELYADSPDGLTANEDYVNGVIYDLVPRLAEKYGCNRTGLMLTGPKETEDYVNVRR